MRKAELKHPYMRGYSYWAPILTEWIESDRYSQPAKEYFRESLNEMLNDRNLSHIQEKIGAINANS